MQDIVIGYAGKYGTTKELSKRLEAELRAIATQSADQRREIDILRLPVRELSVEHIHDARVVVLGGPIYAGRLPRVLRKFCERNRTALLSRDIGLFISCLYQDQQARDQLVQAFPQWLFDHAIASANLGGRVKLDNLKSIDRLLVKRFGKIDQDLDRIDDRRISSFAGELYSVLKRELG